MLFSKIQKSSIFVSSMLCFLFLALMISLLSNPLCYGKKYERSGSFTNYSTMEIVFYEGRIFEAGRSDTERKYQYFYYITSENEIYGLNTTSSSSSYDLQAVIKNKFKITTEETKYDYDTNSYIQVDVEYICHSAIIEVVLYSIAILLTIGIDISIFAYAKKKNKNTANKNNIEPMSQE